MRQLGTIDLEILHLAINRNGTFNETDLEGSELRRLGVGRLLDALATLKDRKMLSLNGDGSFTITEMARGILWSADTPVWARILRLLQIKSCSSAQMADILKISKKEMEKNIERLRKGQFVLMSPQRTDDRVIRVYEILPEGAEEIDRTETDGFEGTVFAEKQGTETVHIIEQIMAEIRESRLGQAEKESLLKRLSGLKERMNV